MGFAFGRPFASGRCDVPGGDTERPPPDPTALGIELAPKKLKLRSGNTGRVTITLRNLTSSPLPLDVDVACPLGFEAMLFPTNETRADSPETCGFGRSCSRTLVRVVLAPRGVARIHVPVSATKALVAEGCTERSLAPIEAGTYKLIVNTPFTSPVAGSNDSERRQVTGELTVVAR